MAFFHVYHSFYVYSCGKGRGSKDWALGAPMIRGQEIEEDPTKETKKEQPDW